MKTAVQCIIKAVVFFRDPVRNMLFVLFYDVYGAVGTAASGEMGKYVFDVGTRPVHVSLGELDARKSG